MRNEEMREVGAEIERREGGRKEEGREGRKEGRKKGGRNSLVPINLITAIYLSYNINFFIFTSDIFS